MISIRLPSQARIDSIFDELSSSDLSYDEVGATRGLFPVGYNVDRRSAVIGRGPADFDRARQAIGRWAPFDLPWVTIFPESTLATGTMIAVVAGIFGVWWTNVSRVIYTIDEPNAFGFAYGTLPYHAETGEERFLVEHDPDSHEVHYRVEAFSRPRHPLARIGYPFSRATQRRFARESVEAMRRSLAGPGK